jgi:hypothetical protein
MKADIKTNHIKAVAIVIATLFVAIILYGLFTSLYRQGKVPVTVKYAPKKSLLLLDGKKLSNNKDNYITPGTYDLEVSADGYKTKTNKVTIIGDGLEDYILGTLDPIGEPTDEYLAEVNKIEKISGDLSRDSGIKLSEDYPVIKHLPKTNGLYSIGYTYLDDNLFTVTIRSSAYYRQAAVNWLLELCKKESISLAEYNIRFVDFNNPFKGGRDE